MNRPSSLAGAAAAALAAGALSLGAAGAGAATLPPELQALQQKAETLKLTSERFVLNFLVKAPSGKETTLLGEGVAAVSPTRAQITESAGGKRVSIRVVGHSVYVNYQGLARVDGGRPWVRVPDKQLSEESGVDLTSGPQSAAQAYTQLDSAAESIKDVGPASIEGQATTEFTATINLQALLSKFGAKLVAKLKKAGVTSAALTEYIAADGLPVRSIATIGVEGGTISVTDTVAAINVPVSVRAPAASRTISYAQFKRLAKKLNGA